MDKPCRPGTTHDDQQNKPCRQRQSEQPGHEKSAEVQGRQQGTDELNHWSLATTSWLTIIIPTNEQIISWLVKLPLEFIDPITTNPSMQDLAIDISLSTSALIYKPVLNQTR